MSTKCSILPNENYVKIVGFFVIGVLMHVKGNVTKYCTSSCWSEHILVTPAEKVRVPVTVITGQLGSGKTTLLNYVLTEQVVNQS